MVPILIKGPRVRGSKGSSEVYIISNGWRFRNLQIRNLGPYMLGSEEAGRLLFAYRSLPPSNPCIPLGTSNPFFKPYISQNPQGTGS